MKGVKVFLRVIGALVLLFGLYLIFFEKQFFGLFLIIVAFLILPILENGKKNTISHDADSNREETASKAVKSDIGSD